MSSAGGPKRYVDAIRDDVTMVGGGVDESVPHPDSSTHSDMSLVEGDGFRETKGDTFVFTPPPIPNHKLCNM